MFHLLREAPRNAIYRHGGCTYRVQSVLRGDRIVRLLPERTRNETIPFVRKNLLLRQTLKKTVFTDLDIAVGRLEITEYLESLTEKDPSGQTRNGWSRPGGMPAHRLRTEGTLIILKCAMQRKLRRQLGSLYPVAAESAERLLAGLFPTVSGPCDPQDYSSGVLTTGDNGLAIVLYDTASGGIGLTEVVFRRAMDLIRNSIERLQACECDTDAGCIRCVVHPHQESAASKCAALALLYALSSSIDDGNGKAWVADNDGTPLVTGTALTRCSECKADVPAESRFCLNCGSKLELANG